MRKKEHLNDLWKWLVFVFFISIIPIIAHHILKWGNVSSITLINNFKEVVRNGELFLVIIPIYGIVLGDLFFTKKNVVGAKSTLCVSFVCFTLCIICYIIIRNADFPDKYFDWTILLLIIAFVMRFSLFAIFFWHKPKVKKKT